MNEEPIQVPTLMRYCSDPVFRAEIDAETARNRAMANAAIDAGIKAYRDRLKAIRRTES